MSVLIKGMEMPTSCLKGGCPLDGFSCQLWEDKYWSRVDSPEKMRHRNCPLIELPDHGDLIDRDALMESLADWQYTESPQEGSNWRIDKMVTSHEAQYEKYLLLGQAYDEVSRFPVVIPAERSEE